MARTVPIDDPMFGDTVGYRGDGWVVRYDGKIEAARWNDRGPAEAHLALLQSGHVQPQPEECPK